MSYFTDWDRDPAFDDALYGSAAWATADDLRHEGVLQNRGQPIHRKALPFGFFEGHQLALGGDFPRICIGGAGCGKTRDLLGHLLNSGCILPMMVLDPRGELWDISVHGLARKNIFAYSWDPYGTGDVQHSVNPLDHFTPDNPALFDEIRSLTRALVPLSGGGEGRFFELNGQSILTALIFNEVLHRGWINFPRLYELIHLIESGLEGWIDILREMLNSDVQYLFTAANVIMERQQNSEKQFGSFMGEIYANTQWLDSKPVRDALFGGDGSLQELVNPALNGGHTVRLHLKVPGSQLENCAPILRVFFDTVKTLRERQRGGPRVVLLIDEAAMLGKNFGSLQQAFSFGRGSGLLTYAIFQSLSQIEENFGRAGIQTFMASAGMRQFMGVRDLQTARLVSAMCGYSTILHNERRHQIDAARRMEEQIWQIMEGGDPFASGPTLAHLNDARTHQSKARRLLIEPDEVLRLGEDQAITFLSGKRSKPILHNKYPYYEVLPAGSFFPNPNHPPTDKIAVRGRFGRKTWLAVRRVRVPSIYAHFPQYTSGYGLEIEGHPL